MKSLKRFSRTISISLVMVLVIALVGVVPAMAGRGGPPEPISNNTVVSIDAVAPPAIGLPVAVTMTVYGRAVAIAGGTIAVTGADVNCPAVLVAAGIVGPCAVTFNSAGAKILTATYTPALPGLPSTDTFAVVVPKIAPTAVTVVVPAVNFVVGIPGPLEVSVSGAGGFPTGTVAVSGTDDDCILTLAPTAAPGVSKGSCNTRFDTVAGAGAVLASYSGDVNYLAANNAPGAVLTVDKGTATLEITSISPSPQKSGLPVTLNVKMTGPGAIPTGGVVVASLFGAIGGPGCGIAIGVDGKGSCILIWGGPPGLYTVSATYSGDANYLVPAAPTTINHRNQLNSVAYYSLSLYDGYVDGTTALGGISLNSTDGLALVGDTALNEQSRPVFAFQTSPLPNTANVTRARLFFAREGVYGSDPFSLSNPLKVAVNTGPIGAPFLELADWNAVLTYDNVATVSALGTTGKKWKVELDGGLVPPANLGINLTGLTQIRMAFNLETNSNDIADYWKIYTGENSLLWNKPRLNIWYWVP